MPTQMFAFLNDIRYLLLFTDKSPFIPYKSTLAISGLYNRCLKCKKV